MFPNRIQPLLLRQLKPLIQVNPDESSSRIPRYQFIKGKRRLRRDDRSAKTTDSELNQQQQFIRTIAECNLELVRNCERFAQASLELSRPGIRIPVDVNGNEDISQFILKPVRKSIRTLHRIKLDRTCERHGFVCAQLPNRLMHRFSLRNLLGFDGHDFRISAA